MPIFIYALVDPFTSLIRYVGKSIRPHERLSNHCNEKGRSWRHHWLRQLRDQGAKPLLRILQEIPDGEEWQSIEQWWISHGRAEGWPLTNCTDGGDGVLHLSGESKARMLRTWQGRKHRPESLLRIGRASKGRKHTEAYKAMMREKMKTRVFTPIHRQRLAKSIAVLSDDEVRTIRTLLATGMSQYAIADRFNVHQGTISNIHRKKNYVNVL